MEYVISSQKVNLQKKKILKGPKKALNLVSSNMMVAYYWFCPEEDELILREDIILLICLLDGILSIFKWHDFKLDCN